MIHVQKPKYVKCTFAAKMQSEDAPTEPRIEVGDFVRMSAFGEVTRVDEDVPRRDRVAHEGRERVCVAHADDARFVGGRSAMGGRRRHTHHTLRRAQLRPCPTRGRSQLVNRHLHAHATLTANQGCHSFFINILASNIYFLWNFKITFKLITFKRNTIVRKTMNVTDVTVQITLKQQRASHITRKNDNRRTKEIMTWYPKRCKTTIKEPTRKMGG